MVSCWLIFTSFSILDEMMLACILPPPLEIPFLITFKHEANKSQVDTNRPIPILKSGQSELLTRIRVRRDERGHSRGEIPHEASYIMAIARAIVVQSYLTTRPPVTSHAPSNNVPMICCEKCFVIQSDEQYDCGMEKGIWRCLDSLRLYIPRSPFRHATVTKKCPC